MIQIVFLFLNGSLHVDKMQSQFQQPTSFDWTQRHANTEPPSAKTHKVRLICLKLQRRAKLSDSKGALL